MIELLADGARNPTAYQAPNGTDGAGHHVKSGTEEKSFVPRQLWIDLWSWATIGLKNFACLCQLSINVATGIETIVSDPHKPLWENMQKEPTQELDRVKCHRLAFPFIRTVLESEGHAAVFKSDDAAV